MKKPLSTVKPAGFSLLFCHRWLKAGLAATFFCALTSSAFGQTQEWARTYPDYPASVSAMVATPDNGYLVLTGKFLIKTDSIGNFNEVRSFGISSALTPTSDGGYLLGGTYRNGYKILKLKDDYLAGTKVWEKTYGGNGTDLLTSIVATSDGGYLLGGISSSGIGGDKTGRNRGGTDYWVIKVDTAGTKIWDKTFGGSNDDTLQELVITPDGGFVLAGTSKSDASGDKTEDRRGRYDEEGNYVKGKTDYWLVKINSNGTKVWDRTYGGGGTDELQAIVATPDGSLIIGGSYVGYVDFETGAALVDGDRTAPAESEEDDFWIFKTDANGNLIWDKAIGGSLLADIIATPDGNYTVAYTNRYYGSSYYGYESLYDFITVKLTAIDGTFTPEDAEYYQSGQSGENIVHAIVTTTNGYLVAGLSFNYLYYWDEDGYDAIEKGVDRLFLTKVETPLPVAVKANYSFGGAGTDKFTQVINTNDGDYLTAGVSNSGSSGDKTNASRGGYDIWVVKTNAAGIKQWDKRFGGAGTESLNSIIQTQDGGYLLGGSSTSGIGGDKTQTNRGGTDYWIVKISGSGAKQWDRRFGGTGFDYLNKIGQLATGEYILAGVSDSPFGGDHTQPPQGGRDQWVLKVSSAGLKIWDRRFGGAANEFLEGLVATADGGVVIGGYSASGSSGNKTQTSRGGYDYWLVKINNNGFKIWDRRFGGILDDKLNALIRTNDGGYLLGGYSNSGNGGDKKQANKGSNDYWVVKTDANGTKIWDKSFGGLRDDRLTALLQTAAGDYVLGGNSLSLAGFDKTEPILGGTDFWLVKINNNGTKLLDQRFGGAGTDEMRTILSRPDGNYLLGGQSTSGISGTKTESSRGGTDMWLVQVGFTADQSTEELAALTKPSAPPVVTEKAVPAAPAPPLDFKATTSPNPFRERVTVQFTLPETQPVSVKVYDLQGQEVANLYQQAAPAHQTCAVEWRPTNTQPAGVYILRLSTAQHTSQQKIVLTK